MAVVFFSFLPTLLKDSHDIKLRLIFFFSLSSDSELIQLKTLRFTSWTFTQARAKKQKRRISIDQALTVESCFEKNKIQSECINGRHFTVFHEQNKSDIMDEKAAHKQKKKCGMERKEKRERKKNSKLTK